jgi:hypothetical protein
MLNSIVVIYFRFKLHFFLPFFLTPWCTVFHVKLIVFKVVNKIPEFYGSRNFITPFTRAQQLSLFWARLFESMPLPTSWRSILILSSHLCLSCKWFLSLMFPHQIRVCTSQFPHTCYMPRLSHSSWFDHYQVTNFISPYFQYFLLTIWSPPDSAFSLYFEGAYAQSWDLQKTAENKWRFYNKVNSAVLDWSRCFPKWLYHFKSHIIWSADTVVSWGTQPLGNSSSLQNEWCCEWQPRGCVRNHSEAMVFRFCVSHIVVLSERRSSTPQV